MSYLAISSSNKEGIVGNIPRKRTQTLENGRRLFTSSAADSVKGV
jgi:hypothetical protein